VEKGLWTSDFLYLVGLELPRSDDAFVKCSTRIVSTLTWTRYLFASVVTSRYFPSSNFQIFSIPEINSVSENIAKILSSW